LFDRRIKIECFSVQSQLSVPIVYKGKKVKDDLRLDLLVEDLIIVEVKAVDKIILLNSAQTLSYLKLTDKPKGLIINFNCENIISQLVPLVTKKFAELPKE
jgi:GxxExxY protein